MRARFNKEEETARGAANDAQQLLRQLQDASR